MILGCIKYLLTKEDEEYEKEKMSAIKSSIMQTRIGIEEALKRNDWTSNIFSLYRDHI